MKLIRPTIVMVMAAALSAAGCDKDEAPASDPAAVEPGEAPNDEAPNDEAPNDEAPNDEAPNDDEDPLAAPDDVGAAPDDATKTDSGLAYKVLDDAPGDVSPSERDTVEVHYTGWTAKGEMFDSSVARGEPAKFPLNGVIPGWTEGLQLMTEGDSYRFWIPAELAYGDKPTRPGAPAGMLVFDVELRDVVVAPTIEVPDDVSGPPDDATKTDSGLSYKALSSGDGEAKPGPTDRVTVHYSGWTTDGEMFDSSVARGEPATFPLNRVIKGWTEGVQLMTVGDTYRFWIPGDLAYGDEPTRPGAPAGTLVFDIELLKID